MNEKLTPEQVEEHIDVIELAEETYWSVLWAEALPYYEHAELLDRELRAEEHEGIFS